MPEIRIRKNSSSCFSPLLYLVTVVITNIVIPTQVLAYPPFRIRFVLILSQLSLWNSGCPQRASSNSVALRNPG